MPTPLILASTSRYRREMLQRLRLPFEVLSPEVDETPLPGEAPAALALRLSLAKARAVQQLTRLSGRHVVFQTGVAVVAPGFAQAELAAVRVRFRVLQASEIEHYLRLEQPYDCAGSAKSETLGIALLEAIDSDDPTALVGLPLIRTCALLRAAGIDPLAAP